MNLYKRFVWGAALLAASPAWAAEPTPAIGPVPNWVVPSQIPQPKTGQLHTPLQYLITASQQRVAKDGVETYIELSAIPQTTAGLQALGNVTVPWNAERTELTLHRLTIRRDGSTIELLKPGAFVVLRRENNLQQAVLDGVRTVVLPADGLEVGDILDVAFSYKTRKWSIGNTPEEVYMLSVPLPITRIERRFLIADDVTVRWKVNSDLVKSQVTKSAGHTEHVFVQTDVEPVKLPKNTPPRFAAPLLQMSAYHSWGDVAEELAGLYDKARKPQRDSTLVTEARKIAAASEDPEKRMLAALRLAQDRVRYVALLLGEGAIAPSSADETWSRKFGDCKGKTALLLALLDQLGIEAEPLLVSNEHDDRIADQLPSMALFDHVIVRAKIGGKQYFLDPTDYGQRSLPELLGTRFSHGLPLRSDSNLVGLPEQVLFAPYREVALTWDYRSGTSEAVPYEATLTLRGPAAATMRTKLSAATDTAEFETGLKDMVPAIKNADLVIVETKPETDDGSFVVRLAGKANMDWSPFRGERNTRYAFSHSTMHWRADFDRSEGPGKEWPVLLGLPYWEKLTETVILPEGGKRYAIDGKPVEKSVAGSTMSRTFHSDGERVSMVSEFRHLKREIPAAEAKAAEPVLEELNEDWAYIVGPPEKKKRR